LAVLNYKLLDFNSNLISANVNPILARNAEEKSVYLYRRTDF